MKFLFNELLKHKISLLLILMLTYISTTFEVTLPLLLANALNVGIIYNYGLEYIEYTTKMMLVLIIVIVIFNILSNLLITRVSTYTSANIKNSIFEKILITKQIDLSEFSTASLIVRTTQDTEIIKNYIFSFLSTVFKAPILLFSCITVLKHLSSDFFTILFISVLILIFFLIFIVVKLIPLSKKLQTTIDTLNNNIKEKIYNHKIIKSYNNIEFENTKFMNTNQKVLDLSKSMIKLSSFINPFLTLIVNTVTIIILVICIKLSDYSLIDAGTIIAAIQYILQILLSIIMISVILINFPTIKVTTKRIHEIFNLQSYNENLETNKINSIDTINFNNISFKYNSTQILDNLNFSIKKGENLGIIGSNGSGKSTIAKLLLKEAKPTTGNILINNQSIDGLSRTDIINNLTYVPQKSYLLKGTILQNIFFTNNKLNMHDITKIIHTCNLEKFINEKPENINFLIEEEGANLSGGQKQRISLARALARDNNLLILDEPFSAIDYVSEKEIISKLNYFYKDKSLVILSQRISSIIHCNKIIVLDKGKIIDTGTHQELLERCNLYKEIYNLQKEVIEYDI